MPKFAPANDNGDKPYVVVQMSWGLVRQYVVYSDGVTNAKYEAVGRQGPGEYVTSCRRATPEDMTNKEYIHV